MVVLPLKFYIITVHSLFESGHIEFKIVTNSAVNEDFTIWHELRNISYIIILGLC
jgi:hypothetical protein